jgi:glycosyltransferase involved in cell wall biosynthesis
MKKILYIITKSNFGGAQRYVYDLATSLPKDAYAVTVAFGGTGLRSADTGALEEKCSEAGIRTIRIEHFMRDVSLSEDVRAFFELWSLIRTEHPDVLHVTSSKAGALGAFAGRLLRVPVIVFTSHGLAFDESWRPRWQRMLIWLATWWTMLCATATIQISHATFERARRMPFLKKKVHCVYNGIDTPDFLTQDEARTMLHARQASENALQGMWIGSIAELHPNKNLTSLVQAVADLKNQGVDAILWLIGDGEERGALATLCEKLHVTDRVFCTGYIEHAARILPAFDVFTLPSKKEGLPYVLLEAGLAGCAVVASNIHGNDDIVEHELSGLLVDTEQPRQMVEALRRLAEDATERERYGTALKKRVQERFSIERMRTETCALYAPSSNPSISR